MGKYCTVLKAYQDLSCFQLSVICIDQEIKFNTPAVIKYKISVTRIKILNITSPSAHMSSSHTN